VPEVSLDSNDVLYEANDIAYEVFVSRVRTADGRLLAITAGADADDMVYVRVATGSNLQQWEKRPDAAKGAFALVSRERPNKCLARKDARNGSALILVDVSEIPKNNYCLWREEGDLRGFHPINSYSDWEQKINIPGNGPYRDGQALCTWEWSGGANNEMWLRMGAGYDLAVGADTNAVNTLSAAVYRGTYPKVFTGAIHIGQLGIDSVAYDIQRAPVFNLKPSGMLAEAMRESFCGQNSNDDVAGVALEASKASFDGAFEVVSVTIHFADQKKVGPLSGVVHASAQAEVQIDSSLVLRFVTGKIEISGIDPDLLDLLNKFFVPLLIQYLNDNVLSPIKIPPIAFEGAKFTMPEVVTQSGTLLAFSALQPSPVAIPPATAWPGGVAFVGADALALNEVANAALGKLKIGDKWDWSCNVGVCTLKLHADYGLNLGGANFKLRAASGDHITGSISFSGRAQFRGDCGVIGLSFGANLNGSGTVTARVQVRGQKVIVIFENLDKIDVRIDITGSIPWPINKILGELIGAFSGAIASTVALFLRGKEFEVYTIPTINFTIAGVGFEVTLTQLRLNTIEGAGRNVLLMVTGLADIRSPGERLDVTWSAPESTSTMEEILA
jgi:hypothetical protein